MSFKVNEIRSAVQKHGVARNNLFLVRITTPKWLGTSEEVMLPEQLVMFCSTAAIPGITLNQMDYRSQGFGPIDTRPVSVTYEPVNALFMLDSNHKILRFFDRWLQEIVNYDMSNGPFSSRNDVYPFEFNYKDHYSTTIEILFFSPNNPNTIYTYKLLDAVPIDKGAIQLGWEMNDQIANLPISFSYSNIIPTGTIAGSVSTNTGRGIGMFEYLFSAISTAQLIRTIKRPRSIQDAINSYSNIRLIADSIF